jgi:hypothetical protein
LQRIEDCSHLPGKAGPRGTALPDEVRVSPSPPASWWTWQLSGVGRFLPGVCRFFAMAGHRAALPRKLAGGGNVQNLFKSYFIGGFECSTHRLRSGKRLDLVAATRHEEFADADYRRLVDAGIRSAREGVRWHLAEQAGGGYDFRTALPIVEAANRHGVQVIWDLCHFGWPDGLDVFRPEFVHRFAAFTRAFCSFLKDHSDAPLHIAPINEISFLSWVGAEVGGINPFAEQRGFELKCQLVRATIAATEEAWNVDPRTRLYQNEPMFNVIPQPDRPEDAGAAEAYRQLQFQTWDLLSGRLWPQLGGDAQYLDVIGLNYYPWNQWYYDGPLHGGATLDEHTPGYRPLSDMLTEVWQRYGRPLYLAETGREGDKRAAWLGYVGQQVGQALQRGVPLEGICLYPIVDFPGWDNDRHCENGLWCYADEYGEREIHAPLAAALREQQDYLDTLINELAEGEPLHPQRHPIAQALLGDVEPPADPHEGPPVHA